MKREEASSMDALQRDVGDWAEETFGPRGSGLPIVKHLATEVVELGAAIANGGYGVEAEVADCTMMLMHVARIYGFSIEEAVREKFAEAKERRWEKDYVEHVRE